MIERYFVKGAMFKWAPPAPIGNFNDGAIVDSVAATAPMTYIGMDPEVIDFGLPNVSTLGFRVGMSIPYQWLSYIRGRTARIATMTDVLTGPMSGCWITTWNDGQRRVGHIGTISEKGKEEAPNSTVKNTFVQAMAPNTTGYNPATAVNPVDFMPVVAKMTGQPDLKVYSLVTAANQFYAVVMIQRRIAKPRVWDAGDWVCAGIQPVPAVNYDSLHSALVTTRPRR